MVGTDKLAGSQIQANVYSKIVDINYRDKTDFLYRFQRRNYYK